MRTLKEIRLLLRHVFSSKRRSNAKTLVKEWLMGLPLLPKKNNGFEQDFPSDPAPDTWCIQESRAIDASYFKQGTAAVIEDRVLDDRNVHTEREYTVCQLNGGITYTNEATHRSIFAQTGERVELLSSAKRLAIEHIPSRRRLSVSKIVSGVTANLYGTIPSAEGNYFHWFVDCLPRLFLIERFHILDKIDQVLVPPLKYDFHWDSLAALGIDRSRIVELAPLECVQFESLLASSAPRGKGSAI